VQTDVPDFAHWYHHRYQPPSLHGRTPAHMRRGFQPLRLSCATRRLIPEPLPITAGRIHFMRQVDVDGTIRLLNESWPIGSNWIGEYVCATIYTSQQILSIWSKPDATEPWHHIKTRAFKLAQPVQPLLPIFRRKRARCLAHWPG